MRERDTQRDRLEHRETERHRETQRKIERARERASEREREKETGRQTDRQRQTERFEGLENLAQLSGTPGAATSDCQIEACVSNDLHAYSAANGGKKEPFLSGFTASHAPAASQVTNACVCVCVYVCVSNAVVLYAASSVIWRL